MSWIVTLAVSLVVAAVALTGPAFAASGDGAQVTSVTSVSAAGQARFSLNGDRTFLYLSIVESRTDGNPGGATTSVTADAQFYDNATWWAYCPVTVHSYSIDSSARGATLQATVDCTETLPSVGIASVDAAWGNTTGPDPTALPSTDQMLRTKFRPADLTGTITFNGETQPLESYDGSIVADQWHDITKSGRRWYSASGGTTIDPSTSAPRVQCLLEPEVTTYFVSSEDDARLRWVRDTNDVYHVHYSSYATFTIFTLTDPNVFPAPSDPGARYRGSTQLDLRFSTTRPSPDENGLERLTFSAPLLLQAQDGSTQTVSVTIAFDWSGDAVYSGVETLPTCS